MKFKQVAEKLREHGWQEVAGGKGSHVKFKHEEFLRPVTVPHHGNRDIAKGTLSSIARGSGIKLKN